MKDLLHTKIFLSFQFSNSKALLQKEKQQLETKGKQKNPLPCRPCVGEGSKIVFKRFQNLTSRRFLTSLLLLLYYYYHYYYYYYYYYYHYYHYCYYYYYYYYHYYYYYYYYYHYYYYISIIIYIYFSPEAHSYKNTLNRNTQYIRIYLVCTFSLWSDRLGIYDLLHCGCVKHIENGIFLVSMFLHNRY